MYFRNNPVRKRGLDKCLKNQPSECISTNNMLNGHKDCWNVDDGTFLIFIDHSEYIQLEKVYVSSMQNLKTVC